MNSRAPKFSKKYRFAGCVRREMKYFPFIFRFPNRKENCSIESLFTHSYSTSTFLWWSQRWNVNTKRVLNAAIELRRLRTSRSLFIYASLFFSFSTVYGDHNKLLTLTQGISCAVGSSIDDVGALLSILYLSNKLIVYQRIKRNKKHYFWIIFLHHLLILPLKT